METRMTRDDYLKFHVKLCDKARSLSAKKNSDYAGDHGMQPFANFERCEALGITTTEKGFLVRMTDKMSRLSTFSETGEFKVSNENFEDTILDIINYSCLLAAYVQQKNCGSEGCCDDESCSL
tara:strand:- start:13672 stop:14040 length:369 start_codon:yes stop_codon:yes gene_type:complete